jgi:hypothetical protein
MALPTSKRPSPIVAGDSDSPAALIATNAEPQSKTVTNPAASAMISSRLADLAAAVALINCSPSLDGQPTN